MYCTLSFNCVQVQTLPTEQAAPALTDSFSRGCVLHSRLKGRASDDCWLDFFVVSLSLSLSLSCTILPSLSCHSFAVSRTRACNASSCALQWSTSAPDDASLVRPTGGPCCCHSVCCFANPSCHVMGRQQSLHVFAVQLLHRFLWAPLLHLLAILLLPSPVLFFLILFHRRALPTRNALASPARALA